MNGILLINKEKGITSHDAINKVKRIIKANKVGHAGTLDPIATGLLVVMINNATKLSDYLMEDNKEYIAEILIGISTDTLDATGVALEEKKVNEDLDVDSVLKSFLGKSKQLPPMYSAIKQNGKKLYELARSGVEVERELRDIEIYEIERVSDVVNENGFVKFSFRAKVSKGTYIRSLCLDIGKKLNYPAHMVNLKRTKIGSLDLKDAYSLKDIEEGNFKLISMLEALKNYEIINVNNDLAKLIFNGVVLDPKEVKSNNDLVVFSFNEEVIAIYRKIDGKYRAERVWN